MVVDVEVGAAAEAAGATMFLKPSQKNRNVILIRKVVLKLEKWNRFTRKQ